MAESKELLQVLWNGADVLRGKMDANEYKTYLLGLVFYKYLSDSYLTKVYDLLNDEMVDDLQEAQKQYVEALKGDDAKDLLEELKKSMHYTLDPEMTYVSMLNDAMDNSFNREKLQAAFNRIQESDELFNGLFADVDLYSNRLGTGDQKQSATIADLIKVLGGADLIHAKGDVLGNAYEYLIGQFASETGKKAGEFYTPQAVSKILTRIAIAGQEDRRGLSVYDPCMGSGSLLLNAKKYAAEPDYIKYYGQELNTSTFNLARMNMFLHNINYDKFNIALGNTLIDPQFGDDKPFDAIVSNPPYSVNWIGSDDPTLINDDRFAPAGVLAPKSKADFAFVLHALYYLSSKGRAAIVCFPGIFYRGGAEQKIRKYLVDGNYVETIISLPSNLFYGTSIAVNILVLSKHKSDTKIQFIDASGESFFTKETNNNILEDRHIDRIIAIFDKKEDVDYIAKSVDYKVIAENDYNLSVSSYIEVEDTRPKTDIKELNERIRRIVARENELRAEIDKIVTELEEDEL